MALRSVLLTAICEFLPAADGGQVLAVALPDAVITQRISPCQPWPQSRPRPPHGGAISGKTRTRALAEAVEPVDDKAASAAAEIGTMPAWLNTTPAQRPALRFVFALDRQGVVERVSPPLAQAVGGVRRILLAVISRHVSALLIRRPARLFAKPWPSGETWRPSARPGRWMTAFGRSR